MPKQSPRRRDIYVSGVHHVEILDENNFRFVFFVRRIIDGVAVDETLEEAMIFPRSAINDGIRKALAASGEEIVGTVKRLLPAWMH